MTEPERCRACAAARDAGQASSLAWSRERAPDGGISWLCDRCARVNLRSIEARLPDEWW
ncbi:hypothetical protein [Pseudonocardia spinosispora]|uniref:hypothetical protein n=1 Tax=Pseudonocardia spinosispora TaxID=103441 RepID=UPI00041C004E|nr:hypothetical protein [Pseudonocardia spinosispora]